MILNVYSGIDGDLVEVLGDYRCKAIANVANKIIIDNARLSIALATSGAMRWPISFRPEVVIETPQPHII